MKVLYLFLWLFVCNACSSFDESKVADLDKKISEVSIMSTSFDSLLSEVQMLPSGRKFECIMKVYSKSEKGIDRVQKQEKLLNGILFSVSYDESKQILLQLVRIYNELDDYGVAKMNLKGLKWIEVLEKYYNLSQKERRQIQEIKILLLNRLGKQEEYLPLRFELLKEYRADNDTENVIRSLMAIANHFVVLKDYDSALAAYKESYQIASDNNFLELKSRISIFLIKHSYDAGYYRESLEYYKERKRYTVLVYDASIQSVAMKCYMKLNKPDSARIVLTESFASKEGQISKTLFDCRMAETYLQEKRIDSAFFYINELVQAFDKKYNSGLNVKHHFDLPSYFLPIYSQYAELLQKNNRTQEVGQYFNDIESLMKEKVATMSELDYQIDALTLYTSYCQETNQFEKALNLVLRRDSLQQVYNNIKTKNDKKNLAERFKIQELKNQLDIRDTTNKMNLRITILSVFLFVILLVVTIAIALMYRNLKRQTIANRRLEAEVKPIEETEREMEKTSIEELPTADQNKLLYLGALKLVRDEKYFLKSDLTIDLLARFMKTNRSYLSKSINLYCNCNFIAWLNNFRIQYAEQLMQENPSMSLKDLPGKCGYMNNDTFIRNFKRCNGMTPASYQEKLLVKRTIDEVPEATSLLKEEYSKEKRHDFKL